MHGPPKGGSVQPLVLRLVCAIFTPRVPSVLLSKQINQRQPNAKGRQKTIPAAKSRPGMIPNPKPKPEGTWSRINGKYKYSRGSVQPMKSPSPDDATPQLQVQPQKEPTPKFGIWGRSTPLDEEVPANRPHGAPSPDSEDSSKSCDRSPGTPSSSSEDLSKSYDRSNDATKGTSRSDLSKSYDRSPGTPSSNSEDLSKRRSSSSRSESARSSFRVYQRPRGRPSSSSHSKRARSPPSYSHSDV